MYLIKRMAVKLYKMCYKLGVIYMAIGIFTNTCGHAIRKKKDKTDDLIRNCTLHFARKIDSCLNPFLVLLKRRLHQKSKSIKLHAMQRFSQKTFCLKYEETLQCLHETLKACETPETTRQVQDKLSAPWVLHVNSACKINMKQEQATSNVVINDSKENYHTETIHLNKETEVPISGIADQVYLNTDNTDQRNTKATEDHNIKGDKQDMSKTNVMLDGVASSAYESTSESNVDNVLKFRPKESVLKYKPNETIINKQTNINVYLNPMDIRSDTVFINRLYNKKMTVTFEKQDKKDQLKLDKWVTKIGKLVFQHRQSL